jgi:hypothetical protein
MKQAAEDHDQARAIIEDQDGGMRSDLKVLVGTDGKPLWDGKSTIEAREATAAQHAQWEQSRDQAISDGEIDLDAGQRSRRVERLFNEHPSNEETSAQQLACDGISKIFDGKPTL